MAVRDFLFEIILFLASAVLGIIAQILPNHQQKRLAAWLAVLLLIVSLAWVGFNIFLGQPQPGKTEVPTNPPATASAASTAAVTAVGTLPAGRIYDFQACPEACDGANSQTTFPQKARDIYLSWKFENLPPGAHFVQTWSVDGREWVRYDCTWSGPQNGSETAYQLAEPHGLASGSWEVEIRVNDSVWLQETITVEGKWDYWDPAGVYHTCYAP